MREHRTQISSCSQKRSGCTWCNASSRASKHFCQTAACSFPPQMASLLFPKYQLFNLPDAPGCSTARFWSKHVKNEELSPKRSCWFFFRGPADVTPNTKYGLPFAYFVSSLFFQVNYGERRKQQNHPNDNISFKNIPCPTAVSSGPLYTSCSTEFARLIHSSAISACTCPHGSSVLLGQGRIPAPLKPPGNALQAPFHHFH